MAIKASATISLSSVTDVASVTRYYLLQSSTLSKPSKPTAKPPVGNWDDTEPGYTDDSTNSLYFTDLTVFSDGTYSYSEVSLSSSYEASKQAVNDAASAKATAEDAKDAADDAQRAVDKVGNHIVMSENGIDVVSNKDGGNRVSITSAGVDIKTSDTNKVSVTSGGVTIYANGSASKFISNGVILGKYFLWHPSKAGGLAFNLYEES